MFSLIVKGPDTSELSLMNMSTIDSDCSVRPEAARQLIRHRGSLCVHAGIWQRHFVQLAGLPGCVAGNCSTESGRQGHRCLAANLCLCRYGLGGMQKVILTHSRASLSAWRKYSTVPICHLEECRHFLSRDCLSHACACMHCKLAVDCRLRHRLLHASAHAGSQAPC